jgi:hypothetical protein
LIPARIYLLYSKNGVTNFHSNGECPASKSQKCAQLTGSTSNCVMAKLISKQTNKNKRKKDVTHNK